MLIIDCMFRASHKHWADNKNNISMIVTPKALVFVNTGNIVIHTLQYRIIIKKQTGECSYWSKDSEAYNIDFVCSYAAMFANVDNWSYDRYNILRISSLVCNSHFKVGILICDEEYISDHIWACIGIVKLNSVCVDILTYYADNRL